MKTRISLWVLAAAVLLLSGGCATQRKNIAACSKAVQADARWSTPPGYRLSYSSANHDGSRVFVEAKAGAPTSGKIAQFFYFETKASQKIASAQKTASAECLFEGTRLSSWRWLDDKPNNK
jgi:hypothetical protein